MYSKPIAQYDKIAEAYRDVSMGYVAKRYCQVPTFLGLCKDLTGKRVLDIGCGFGLYSELIKRCGATRVVGLDMSEKEIALAKTRAVEQNLDIEYLVADAFDFEFAKLGKFDMVAEVFLLHYADSREKLEHISRNIKNALNENGCLVATVPNPKNLSVNAEDYAKYGQRIKCLDGKFVPGTQLKVELFDESGKNRCEFWAYYWDKATYDGVLENAGFENISWHPPIISQEGMYKYGPKFWEAMLNAPTFMCITAK